MSAASPSFGKYVSCWKLSDCFRDERLGAVCGTGDVPCHGFAVWVIIRRSKERAPDLSAAGWDTQVSRMLVYSRLGQRGPRVVGVFMYLFDAR